MPQPDFERAIKFFQNQLANLRIKTTNFKSQTLHTDSAFQKDWKHRAVELVYSTEQWTSKQATICNGFALVLTQTMTS